MLLDEKWVIRVRGALSWKTCSSSASDWQTSAREASREDIENRHAAQQHSEALESGHAGRTGKIAAAFRERQDFERPHSAGIDQ